MSPDIRRVAEGVSSRFLRPARQYEAWQADAKAAASPTPRKSVSRASGVEVGGFAEAVAVLIADGSLGVEGDYPRIEVGGVGEAVGIDVGGAARVGVADEDNAHRSVIVDVGRVRCLGGDGEVWNAVVIEITGRRDLPREEVADGVSPHAETVGRSERLGRIDGGWERRSACTAGVAAEDDVGGVPVSTDDGVVDAVVVDVTNWGNLSPADLAVASDPRKTKPDAPIPVSRVSASKAAGNGRFA